MIVFRLHIIALLIFIVSCSSNSQPQKDVHKATGNTLTIAFAGDVLLDRKVKETIDSLGHSRFIGMSYFFETDFSIVNFESPATKNGIKRKKKFTFNAHPEDIEILQKMGVTHANLSNNHSIDCGRNGLIETVGHLNDFNIQTTGYGITPEDACQPTILSKNNQEIAVFSTVGIPIEYYYTLDDKPGICTMSVNDICENIDLFKAQHPDTKIFVQIHWGKEYEERPSLTQRKQAYQLINAGADVVIGHHPHVIQPIELYKNKPIFYSIGNFIFDLSDTRTHLGLVPLFTIQNDQITFRLDSINLRDHIPSKI